MPPKKSTTTAASNDGLVYLAFKGEGERTFEHPETGLVYAFNPTNPSWVPADLAKRLIKDDPARFAIAKPEPAFETLGA